MTDAPLHFNFKKRWSRAAMILLIGSSLSLERVRSADRVQTPERLLTGTIYQVGSGMKKVLFNYKRVATSSGSQLRVVQEYDYPDGKPAARETVVFNGGRLISFELEEMQTGAGGRAVVEVVGGTERLMLSYLTAEGDKKQDDEAVRPNTIVNASVPEFLERNWSGLMSGRTISSRFIVISRTETVGFEFKKVRETVWDGKPAVVIRMKPSSFLIAALVNPLVFTVKAGGEHRVFTYTGRTTPKVMEAGKWKDLEAVTVFDF